MPEQLFFTIEVFLNGLMTGVLYSLVALGFVLIYKASGIFNYAQGVMALFAAMTLVGIMEGRVPFAHLINAILGTKIHHFGWHVNAFLALILTMGVMLLLAWLVQKVIFKHLVNQEGIILFMATIGLAYFLEGVGDLMWGANVKRLDVGLPEGPSDFLLDHTGMFIEKLEISAAVVAIILVASLMLFSQYVQLLLQK